MKIVVFGPDKRTGVLRGADVVDISLAHAAAQGNVTGAEEAVPSELGRFIAGGDAVLAHARAALDHLAGASDQTGPGGEQIVFAASDVTLHAPRPLGAKVACAGGNFADHAAAMAERAAARGDMRAFEGDAYEQIRKTGIWGFWKLDRDSLGPDGDLTYPTRAKRLDYEGELAIVIGKQGKDIPAGDIKDYIYGVTLLGDWSARLTVEPGPLKFALQKNFDDCCSIGPCILVDDGTEDAVDPFDAEVETLVNGERRQHYSTKDMVFTFGEYLEHLSRDFTFYPGDLIAGGTAAGTASDSGPLLEDGTPAPEPFLKPGDVAEIRNPVIGTLRANIVAK
ncbi:MAG: fumarylacetoacetate hydrolase family protein [Rhodospirillaceae bacterium]|nr:fumarylacetoacetate hydrolase family protein [Rhodospirillaceae bacterium]